MHPGLRISLPENIRAITTAPLTYYLVSDKTPCVKRETNPESHQCSKTQILVAPYTDKLSLFDIVNHAHLHPYSLPLSPMDPEIAVKATDSG